MHIPVIGAGGVELIFKCLPALLLLGVAALAGGCYGGGGKSGAAGVTGADEDPYLWLEDVTGEKALAWVRARNDESARELTQAPGFAALEADLLKILDSDARIPSVTKRGNYYYNFWQDRQHPKGLWRRTTPDEYRKDAPRWETILDLDLLGRVEKENWVWKNVEVLKAGGHRHALVYLSRGGADAVVIREFDIETKSFVKDGFVLPEAKGEAIWIDHNHIYVSSDFGPGSLTTSGYPRIVKRWTRGTPPGAAVTVFEGKTADVSVGAIYDELTQRHFVYRSPGFYDKELYLLEKDDKTRKVEVPLTANSSIFREWLLLHLRESWTVAGKSYAAGTLLAADFADWMRGGRELTVLFAPTSNAALAGWSWTRHHLIVNILEDVKNRLVVMTPPPASAPEGGDWKSAALPGVPDFTEAAVRGVDPDESDEYFMTVSGYLTPTTLLGGVISPAGRAGRAPEKLKELPALFDATGLGVSQHFAVSKDGTRVPYFEVAARELKLDGARPTLLYGYGGFEIPMMPAYSPQVGRGWLAAGGVYVVANIRGGGEYGPRWHQAALREKRLRAYEDFAAVAEDLIRRRVTSPRHLGTMGGSNGGLLMGNMITRYPQLFGAVVCQVPLLDMKRYSHLLAGASWMAEYGDPDKPEDWAFIKDFSAYHNVRAGVKYPPVLFTTSTRDDRVHPGHARKMMAKMMELGADVRYYENIEGGHGGAADNAQLAHRNALAYEFLWQKLR